MAKDEPKYDIPIQEAIKRVLTKHPHCRLQENNKVLNWLVVKLYSPAFRAWLYDHPEYMSELIDKVPDFDSITRARQMVQNQCHKCNHSKVYHKDEKGQCSECNCQSFEGWFTDEIRKLIPPQDQDLKEKTPHDLTRFLTQS